MKLDTFLSISNCVTGKPLGEYLHHLISTRKSTFAEPCGMQMYLETFINEWTGNSNMRVALEIQMS